MKKLFSHLLLSLVAAQALAQTPIECAQANNKEQALWPGIYLSKSNQLCFNVKGWPGFRGQNCVANGKTVSWHAIALITDGDQSFGRDATEFRVKDAVVTSERIQYIVEWRRGGDWRRLQDISIDRLTGTGVSYFLDMHGGEPLSCKRSIPKV